MDLGRTTIAIIGLGYVGLPLAVEFGKKRRVIGFDVRQTRVEELRAGHDGTREVEAAELKAASGLTFSCSTDDLKQCGVFIVAVPTPIDRANRPDLTLLEKASATVDVFDPWADRDEARAEYGVEALPTEPVQGIYDAIIVAVGHREFMAHGAEKIRAFGEPGAVLFDVKGMFDKSQSDGRL